MQAFACKYMFNELKYRVAGQKESTSSSMRLCVAPL